jgi:hypothetical protein
MFGQVGRTGKSGKKSEEGEKKKLAEGRKDQPVKTPACPF